MIKQNESVETMNWYAVRTQNNKERSVLERLKAETKFSKLESKLGRTIIPTEKIFSVKDGKRVIREKIIYPGYIFIETSAKGELINLLKGINGAAGFVRTRSGEIMPMKDYEVKKIIVEQEETDTKDISTVFIIGEEVEIMDGPFASFRGKIDTIDQEKQRVKILVLIFGRATAVDLNFSQIKKI